MVTSQVVIDSLKLVQMINWHPSWLVSRFTGRWVDLVFLCLINMNAEACSRRGLIDELSPLLCRITGLPNFLLRWPQRRRLGKVDTPGLFNHFKSFIRLIVQILTYLLRVVPAYVFYSCKLFLSVIWRVYFSQMLNVSIASSPRHLWQSILHRYYFLLQLGFSPKILWFVGVQRAELIQQTWLIFQDICTCTDDVRVRSLIVMITISDVPVLL